METSYNPPDPSRRRNSTDGSHPGPFMLQTSWKRARVLVLLLLFSGWMLPATATTALQPDTEQLPAFPSVAPEDAGFCADRLARLTDVLHEYADRQRLSGGVALVLRDGQAVVNEAFGKLDVESGIPMSHNALFRMASQTKAIISVAVMMLQEEGELLISDPLGKYLPEFSQTTVAVRRKDPAAHPPDGAGSENPGSGGDEVSEEDMEEDMEQDTERVETRDWVAVPASRPITIRDLLMHTAGISYGYGLAAEAWQEAGIQGWYLADRDEPIREIVRRMASLPFDAHPGERFVYGYANDILGALIEEISGFPLDRFLQERLFDPLEMHETWFFVPEEQAARLATVYSATEDGGIVRAPDPGRSVGQGHYLAGPRTTFSGGAGLVSTAADYARFLQMMLNGGELDGRRILSPRTVELMTVDHLHGVTFRPGLGIGLGFDVVTNPGVRGVPGAVGDFGWGGAYHSTYWVSPQDRLVVVFFTQLIPSHGSDIHGKLRTLLYQSLIDP